MSDVTILYTIFNQHLPGNMLNHYLNLLPPDIKVKNQRYCRWQDCHSHLFGKLLLLTGLKEYGFTDKILNQIKYNQYSRPFIDGNIDFNISHSGGFVICAIGKFIRLGVDVEKIRNINIPDFFNTLSNVQIEKIEKSKTKLLDFFKYWTIKESVIKADGRGLTIPLSEILINENEVLCNSKIWYYHDLSIHKDYCSYLTTNKPTVRIDYNYIDFNPLAELS